MSKKALIVMAKRPFPGETKTRLVPPLTNEEASGLYECFLRDTVQLARTIPHVVPILAYTPAEQEAAVYFSQLAPDFEKLAQTGNTLGERLAGVLRSCLDRGYNQVVAMNSDSPLLPSAYLMDAFRQLDDPQVDVVLGPCVDGGYYLIGWKKPHTRLVRDVKMSTDHVLADTLEIAAAEKLQFSLLEPWYDVDDLDDLTRLQNEINLHRKRAPNTRRFIYERLGKQ